MEQTGQFKDCSPMPITHPCLQSAYGRYWSLWHAGTRIRPRQNPGDGTFPCLNISLTCPSQMPRSSTSRTAATWKKHTCLWKASVWQSHTLWLKSTSQHPKLADHHHPLHHRCRQTTNPIPQGHPNHNQMYDMTTSDICHVTLTGRGDATSVQRKCWDRNARNVMYVCHVCMNAKQECFAAYHQKWVAKDKISAAAPQVKNH